MISPYARSLILRLSIVGILTLLIIAGLLGLFSRMRPPAEPALRPTRTPLAELVLPTYPPLSSPPPTVGVSDWESLLPGFELRIMELEQEGIEQPIEVVVLRIDPMQVDLRVLYDTHTPIKISEWQRRTNAPLVINGGFFYPSKSTLGLLVVDGIRHGDSFSQHGGMLRVDDGAVDVRSLAQFPYDPVEPMQQAMQGRPMLLYPGGFPAEFALSAELSRRTAVGLDSSGRLIFVSIDYGAVSLYSLRDWMADEDELDLFVAFNLDGGGSTGLALETPGRSLLIESWATLPSIIAIYPKDGE